MAGRRGRDDTESRQERTLRSRTAPSGGSLEEFGRQGQQTGLAVTDDVDLGVPNAVALTAALCNNAHAVGEELPQEVRQFLAIFCEASPLMGSTGLSGDNRPHPWAVANLVKPLNTLFAVMTGQFGDQKGTDLVLRLLHGLAARFLGGTQPADRASAAGAALAHASALVRWQGGRTQNAPVTALQAQMQHGGASQGSALSQYGQAVLGGAATGAAVAGPWGALAGAGGGALLKYGERAGWLDDKPADPPKGPQPVPAQPGG